MTRTDWIDRELAKRGPKAARCDARHDRVVVEMTNGCVFVFPPSLAEGLPAFRCAC